MQYAVIKLLINNHCIVQRRYKDITRYCNIYIYVYILNDILIVSIIWIFVFKV